MTMIKNGKRLSSKEVEELPKKDKEKKKEK